MFVVIVMLAVDMASWSWSNAVLVREGVSTWTLRLSSFFIDG